jgi:putative NADH-flavin reductase
MVITIFGATGIVGSQLLIQALAKGHTVKAFGRNVSNLIDADLAQEKFEAIKGYVFDEDDVFKAIKGSDAVLSALGGDVAGKDKTRSLGIKNVVKQMQKANVNRIVALGGFGILNSSEDTLIIDLPTYPTQYLPVGKEHLEAYNYLKESNLNWTFVCSPDIHDDKANGKYSTRADYPPEENKGYITSGNLAHFMVGELENNQFVKQRVGISNAD